MITHQDYIEILGLCVGPAIIGMAMATARHVRKGSYKGLLINCLTSAIVSIITGCLLDICNLPPTVCFAIIGLAGYGGGSLLDAASWRMEKEIKTARLPLVGSNMASEQSDESSESDPD